jgi:hypothetical protein
LPRLTNLSGGSWLASWAKNSSTRIFPTSQLSRKVVQWADAEGPSHALPQARVYPRIRYWRAVAASHR